MTNDRFAPSTLGRLQRQLDTPSFRITAAAYAPHLTFAPHSHEKDSITVVTSGGFTESFPHGAETCSPMSVLTKPAGMRHANSYGAATTGCLLIAVLDRPDVLSGVFDKTNHLRGGKAYALALGLERELRRQDDLAAVSAEGLTLELLSEIGRRTTGLGGAVPRWLFDLRDKLREECCTNVSLERIAAVTGMHPVYVSRAFRQHFRMSPIEFVRRCRIEWAIKALLETDLSINNIGIRAGFADQSHFTRTFTRYTGRSPGELRRNAPPAGQ